MRAIAEGLFTDETPPRLIGGRDRVSGRIVFPCPPGTEFEPVPLGRHGSLWSFTVQRYRPKSPPYAGPEAFTPWAVGYVELPGDSIGTQTCGLDAVSARRGTIEHRVFEGTDAVAGDRLRVLVSCRGDAGTLDVPVAYAIAVTLEVGADVAIDIYQEISTRIRPVVEVEAAP